MADTGIGQKIVEAGMSAAKATADEVKNSISTATTQITGAATQSKSDQELQHLEKTDKDHSTTRIEQIKKELASQRFNEVSQWNTSAPQKPNQENSGPDIPSNRGINSNNQQSQNSNQPEVVRQAVGKTELGRNYKG
jgi:hypothetical protein